MTLADGSTVGCGAEIFEKTFQIVVYSKHYILKAVSGSCRLKLFKNVTKLLEIQFSYFFIPVQLHNHLSASSLLILHHVDMFLVTNYSSELQLLEYLHVIITLHLPRS